MNFTLFGVLLKLLTLTCQILLPDFCTLYNNGWFGNAHYDKDNLGVPSNFNVVVWRKTRGTSCMFWILKILIYATIWLWNNDIWKTTLQLPFIEYFEYLILIYSIILNYQVGRWLFNATLPWNFFYTCASLSLGQFDAHRRNERT